MSGSDYTQTPNLGLYKPVYDADIDQWGNHLNSNCDTLDSVLATSGASALFVPLAGGSMTGPLILSTDPSAALGAATMQYADAHGPVASVAGRTGAITLTHTDITDWTATLAPYALTTSLPPASNTLPLVEGTAAIGTATAYARADHVHPTGGGGSSSSVTVSDTPPATPKQGDMWWDSVSCQMFVWYQDGTSNQWVPANNYNGPLSEAPTDGQTYGRRSNAWAAVPVTTGNVGRNLLMNGMFNVQQRGAGNFTTNAAYTADRWQLTLVSDTVSFGCIPPGVQAGLDESAAFVMRNAFTGNAAAGAFHQLSQKIEKVSRLSAQTVTVSFYAQAASAGLKLGANIYQYFGSGGSPSAGAYVQATGASFTLTTGWARYSATFTVPSISGKTLGTNGDDFHQFVFAYSSGATNNAVLGNVGVQSGSIYIWGVQLEIGNTATPLERPASPGDELRACQRFYQTAVAIQAWGIATGPSQHFGGTLLFPVSMRASPTIAYNGTSYSNCAGLATNAAYGSTMAFYAVSSAAGEVWVATNFAASADL